MKLLRKTSNTYLIILATSFLVAAVVIYFVLSYFLEAQIIENINNEKQRIIQKIESEGIIHNDPPYQEVTELKNDKKVSDKSSDTLLFDLVENERIPFRQLIAYESINRHFYRIIIRRTLIEKSDILVTIILTMLSVFTLLLLALFLINRNLSFRIWKPFYGILADLKKFSPDNPSFTLSSPGEINEFKELNSTLEKLTRKVISYYQSLKRFTEDASHEIQTPISIIKSNLESLLQTAGLDKNQARLIREASLASSRLSKLVQTLLLITKIENRQFTDKEIINFSLIVSNQIELFQEIINDKEIHLLKRIDSPCNLNTNSFLAESLIRNLIGNAVKYCNNKGNLEITLADKKLEISNTGIPLPVKPEKLFERFYKVSQSSDSFGLGLSIVKLICDVNSWQISYSNVNDMHLVKIIF